MKSMKTGTSEIGNRRFGFFLLRVLIGAALVFGVLVGINYFVDASHVITSRSHEQMAVLALEGNTVAMPENYNERSFQMAVVDHMKSRPETLVLGSSRGMSVASAAAFSAARIRFEDESSKP